MRIALIEHSPWQYRADALAYGLAWGVLATTLVWRTPAADAWWVASLALSGLAAWTLVEYLLHRFVLHGLRPFSTWHAEHHRRPTALIQSPTVLSATLLLTLVFLPAWLLGGTAVAGGIGFGMLTGYAGYGLAHHANHHVHARGALLRKRQQWHALHHSAAGLNRHYGVTSGLWDRVFGTA